MKKIIVLSLGGSLIVPGEIDLNYLKELKKVILKNTNKYKFVIVCGGGSTARKYIYALREIKANEKLQSLVGISATRLNARFVSYFFEKDPAEGIPHSMKAVTKYLKKQDIVFCGGLEYKPRQTSDATAVQIASHFKTEFVNLTDVPGLYDKNPKKFKDAKFIPNISLKEFYNMIPKKYEPGQHFVLDQTASELILKNKIKTRIIGKDVKQLDNLLNNKKFKGTIIEG